MNKKELIDILEEYSDNTEILLTKYNGDPADALSIRVFTLNKFLAYGGGTEEGTEVFFSISDEE